MDDQIEEWRAKLLDYQQRAEAASDPREKEACLEAAESYRRLILGNTLITAMNKAIADDPE